MKAKRLKWLAALILILALSGCTEKLTEEERVRQTVREAAEAVRAKDLKGFMRLVSKDYNDEGGNDYDSVKGIIFFQLMKPGAIRVFFRGVEVEIKEEGGQTALVNARAFIVRASAPEGIPEVIPEDAEGFRFSVVMRREDGEWRALSAKWDEVGVLGLL